MRAKIGPYITWWGPYQIADLLQKVGVSEDRCYKIGSWLAETWLNDICEWIHSKRNRTIDIKIDRYDTWSADCTMALIIYPMLVQYQKKMNGSPFTDDEDVPESLRSTHSKPFNPDNGDIDDFHQARWEWIVNEMVWAFEQIVDDDNESQFFVNGYDHEACKAHHERINRGTTLFGKYFRGLWT